VDLPAFGIDAYDDLLERLRAAGYAFARVAELPELPADGRHVLLRHDVDLDPPSTLAMAEREAARGIASTYYVGLTLHFNALHGAHRGAIRHLHALGHDIGLHYDLRTYPADPDAARAHLDWELSILEGIVGAPVRTLCMHQPSLSPGDPFRSVPGLVHPHDPAHQEGMLYVSDSARAWRDASLLRALGDDPPARLLLLVHPESWLDPTIDDPLDYLEQVVLPLSLAHAQAAHEDEVAAWRSHVTARTRA
jgi:hypothetical protein